MIKNYWVKKERLMPLFQRFDTVNVPLFIA